MPPFTHRTCLTLHPVLAAVFHDFDAAGVHWCLLRLPFDPGQPSGGDVDLLIDGAHLDVARRLLEGLQFVPLPAWGRRSHTHFVHYDFPTACWIWLDIAIDLSFGPYHTLQTRAEADCLARCQRQDGAAVLAPADAFWVLLLHCVLDKGVIAPRHRTRLQELRVAVSGDDPLAQVIEEVCPAGWSPRRMLECVSRADWIALEGLCHELTAAWMRRQSVKPYQLHIQRGLRLLGRARNALRYPGLSVALLGPDGAGKSTLAAGIQTAFIFPARSVYMGLYGGYLTRLDKLRAPVLVVPGRVLILWYRYLTARYHQRRGRLVIFDRYTYDGLLPSRAPLNWRERLARWVDAHALPAPDLALILDAPGKLMYARKGRRKHSPEELEGVRQHFLTLRHHRPELQLVDATRDQEMVRADVINRIWGRYAARWTGRQRCNGRHRTVIGYRR
jgi:thymidylate kinase